MKSDKITEEELRALKQAKRMLSGSDSEPETLEEKLALLSEQILSILEPNIDKIVAEKKTSFYQINKVILTKIDPTFYSYYYFLLELSDSLKTKEYDKNDLNIYIKHNIFAPSIESAEEYGTDLKELLKNDVAIVYITCADHGIMLDDIKPLPDMLSQDITEILGEYNIYTLKGDDIIEM